MIFATQVRQSICSSLEPEKPPLSVLSVFSLLILLAVAPLATSRYILPPARGQIPEQTLSKCEPGEQRR
jgi:hypothetical protein